MDNRKIVSPGPSTDVEINPSGDKRVKISNSGGIIIGNDPDDANNVKLHRGPNESLQILIGNDITVEGLDSPNKKDISVNSLNSSSMSASSIISNSISSSSITSSEIQVLQVKSPIDTDLEMDPSGTKRAKISQNGGIILGGDVSDVNNVKLHRGPSGSLQVVAGNDTTTEGLDSPNKKDISVNSIITYVPIVPTGTILNFAGTVAPTGYFICDGSTKNKADYPSLYTVIGDSWTSIPSPTTFKIPNLLGAFLRGSGTGTINTRNKVGPSVGSFQEDQSQGHQHTWPSYHDGAGNVNQSSEASINISGSISSTATVTDGVNGTPRTGTETHPYCAGVTYIIKY